MKFFNFFNKSKYYDAYYYLNDSDEESVIEILHTNLKAKSKREVRERVLMENPHLMNKTIFVEKK